MAKRREVRYMLGKAIQDILEVRRGWNDLALKQEATKELEWV